MASKLNRRLTGGSAQFCVVGASEELFDHTEPLANRKLSSETTPKMCSLKQQHLSFQITSASYNSLKLQNCWVLHLASYLIVFGSCDSIVYFWDGYGD